VTYSTYALLFPVEQSIVHRLLVSFQLHIVLPPPSFSSGTWSLRSHIFTFPFHCPVSVLDPSLTLTQFCVLLKTVLFCRTYDRHTSI